MGKLKIDVLKLAQMGLDKDKLEKFLITMQEFESALMEFDKQFNSGYVCPVCCLRKYIELSLNWNEVLSVIKYVRDTDMTYGNIIQEILVATHFVSYANNMKDFVREEGDKHIKLMGIKDQKIDVLRVFGLMMNLFIKESVKKLLDKLTKLVYDIGVEANHAHFIIDFFLSSLMTTVGQYSNMFNENTLTGVIQIRKVKSNDSGGLSCEEPLILEYNIYGTPRKETT